METAVLTSICSLTGVIIGGVITFLINRQNNKYSLLIKQEENKTINSAEETIRYYLLIENSETRYERSFEHLKTKLPGFTESELQKILIRSGAVRFIRDDGSEWWCHISRLEEKYKKEAKKRKGNCSNDK